MKIAFWNVGGMGDAGNKKNVVSHWVTNNAPDILIFEEISATLEDNLDLPNDLALETWVITLDRNNARSTKDLAVFSRNGFLTIATSTPTPFLKTVQNERADRNLINIDPRRDLVQIAFNYQGADIHIYGLHANASYSGGATAVACLDKLIARNNQMHIIAGGDFNSNRLGRLSDLTKYVAPIGHDGSPLTFTQWNKELRPAEFIRHNPNFDEESFRNYVAQLNLPGFEDRVARWARRVEPHGVIDYALCSLGLPLTAANCCVDAEEWFLILQEFDHTPVVYTL